MDVTRQEDNITKRIQAMCDRVETVQSSNSYFYNIPVSEIMGGTKVLVDGRVMEMFSSYSYLSLIGHPRINKAARDAIDQYGTGTHGVRSLAGSLGLHTELEETLAEFKGTEAAITFSSGYATNLTTVSALVGRHDTIFSDKLNHASIVDGTLLSGAKFIRYRHNDMEDLEARMAEASAGTTKLVITDAVFSMDGDIVDLPNLVDICRRNDAWLMVDEAHSVGVLGEKGAGIEEHFGMPGVIDIKMGTLSKTIPSVGGYIAGKQDLITYLRHQTRAYIFSAALPPAQAAASLEAFKVIQDEPWRVERLRDNYAQFIGGLQERGFDTMKTETAIVPVLCGTDEMAFTLTRASFEQDIFVLPVVSPAVPEGLSRLRATVTAEHESEQIERAMDVILNASQIIGAV